MSNIKLDRSPLAPGTYPVRIQSVEEKMGKSGFPYINLELDVLDEETYKSTDNLVWDIISKSPKSRFIMNSFLDALQAPTEGEITNRSLRGKRLWVNLDKRTYQGKVSMEVTGYLPPETVIELKGEDAVFENEFELADGTEEEEEGPGTMKAFNPLEGDVDDEGNSISNVPDELESEDLPF